MCVILVPEHLTRVWYALVQVITSIIESVDFQGRDGTDAKYMQYLSKSPKTRSKRLYKLV